MTGMTHLLRYMAVLAFFITPAHAQENPDFFGVWEPFSTSANMHSIRFEKGRLHYSSPYVSDTVSNYRIIRDFGDRLLVRTLEIEGDLKGREFLEMFVLSDPEFSWDDDDPIIMLSIFMCEYQYVLPDLLENKDSDVIWGKLMDWSRKNSPEKRFHKCALTEQGVPMKNGSWGGNGKFTRHLNQK
ncbi:hypothetical protein KAR91_19075 [Candidatus Pacearchaeota archaeon]|nr:hypothetical protein [Candidatus Pacearchaeota archaeon]